MRFESLFGSQRRLRVISRPEPPEQRVGFQSCAVAGGARRIRAILRQQHADVHLVGPGSRATRRSGARRTRACPPSSPSPSSTQRRCSCESDAHGVSIGTPRLRANLMRSSWHSPVRLCLPGPHGAAPERLRLVRNDQPEVDADDATETAAGLAGAERRVEGEQTRRRLLIVDVALGAVQVGGEAPAALGWRLEAEAGGRQRFARDLTIRSSARPLSAFIAQHDATRPRPTRRAASSASTMRSRSSSAQAHAILDHLQTCTRRFHGGLRCLAPLRAFALSGLCCRTAAARTRACIPASPAGASTSFSVKLCGTGTGNVR